MAYWLRIFCRSARLLPASDIRRWVEDGLFFDLPPRIEVEPPSGEPVWRRISIAYQPDRSPIQIERNVEDALFYEELHETADAWCALDLPRRLVEQLQTSRQVIVIRLDGVQTLPPDLRDLTTGLNAFIAQALDGLIDAPGEGVYDAQLQLIHGF